MKPWTLVGEAFHSLNKNVAQTILSILGIVIGIGAVIAMVAVANGTQRAVDREIAAMGDDWCILWYQGRQRGGARTAGGLSANTALHDSRAVLEECPAVDLVSLRARIWSGTQVVSSYGNMQCRVEGVEPTYFEIRRRYPTSGRAMNVFDLEMQNKVAWIGTTVSTELFGPMDPVGQTIRIGKHAYEVAGVLNELGSSSDGDDLDEVLVIPVTTFRSLLDGNDPIRSFFFRVTAGYSLETAKQQVRDLIRMRHRVPPNVPDHFRMWDRADDAERRERTTQQFNALLTSIAAISLLVGGVGIMNIMLVSVTERTREVGLRMAIGASSSQILAQFLLEALVLTTLGGILGFAAGVGLANMGLWAEWWTEISFSYWMAMVAIGVSCGVGLIFGLYPAWRASRLDPIDALRFE